MKCLLLLAACCLYASASSKGQRNIRIYPNKPRGAVFPSLFSFLFVSRSPSRSNYLIRSKTLKENDEEDENDDDDDGTDEDDEKSTDHVKDFELTADDFVEAVIETSDPILSRSQDKNIDSNAADDGKGSNNRSDDVQHVIGKGSEDESKEETGANPADPEQEERNREDLALIKSVWREFLQLPPSEDVLRDLLKHSGTVLKINGTDKESFYQQLLVQFLDPLQHIAGSSSSSSSASMGKRALWLDEEFVLKLKGLALLSLHPHATHTFSGLLSSNLSRGVRLHSPQPPAAAPGPSHSQQQSPSPPIAPSAAVAGTDGLAQIQSLLAKALAHSIRAQLVVVNQKVVEKVQELALAKGVRNTRLLSKATLLSALMDLSDEKDGAGGGGPGRPLVIVFNDQLTWLLHNRAASSTVLEEFRNDKSRIFFLLLQPSEELRVGQVPPSLQPSPAISAAPSGSARESGDGEDLPDLSALYNSFSAAQQGPGAGRPPFPPPGMAMPFFPAPSAGGKGTMAYHVVVENGSITAFPVPPPGIPPTAMSVIRASIPPFPPLSTPEEVQDFINAEENRRKLTGIIENILSNAPQPHPMPNAQRDKNTSYTTQFRFARMFNPRQPQPLHPPAPASQSQRPTTAPPSPAKVFDKEDVDETALPAAGKALLRSFEELLLTAPSDQSLKILWDQIVDEEVGQRIAMANRRLLSQELRRSQVNFSSRLLDELDDLLRCQVLSRDQVRETILLAIKLQAGKASLGQVAQMDVSEIDESAAAGRGDLVDFLDRSQRQPTDAKEPRRGRSKQLELSLWAVDTALSSAIKVSTPRLGKPLARSKEEILALPLERSEKALIQNVISPQDIGVTYDMIGGLDEIKELLRQSITYPLKYPRLYQEGIASEAVKGVLLFGPPGKSRIPLLSRPHPLPLPPSSQAPARRCWPRQWPPRAGRPSCRSTRPPSRASGSARARRTPRQFLPWRGSWRPALSTWMRWTRFFRRARTATAPRRPTPP